MNRRDFLLASAGALAGFARGGGPAPAEPLFDAHFHVIDPRFPLTENEGFVPEPFTVADYLRAAKPLGVTGGAVVAGSFQGFDRSFLADALAKLGPSYVGVVQLPFDVKDDELLSLDRAGVRAVRLTLRRGKMPEVSAIERFAKRLHDRVGWHLELYVGPDDLEALHSVLLRLPKISIDHLGLAAKSRPRLLELAARGAQIKATGFGRVDFDVAAMLKAIAAANPKSLAFGTDLPSTRAPRPFRPADVALVRATLDGPLARAALHDNAVTFYRPRG